MTEMYIQNQRVDMDADISALLTFALDDVKDFGNRQTTFSKTIVLPGTSNNSKLFGHIFQFGSSNAYDAANPNIGYNFNAAKSAECIIFQNNLQTFQGSLRLLTINQDKGGIDYEVAVFGNLSLLNVALSPNSKAGTGLLENLDFSAYDDTYTYNHITLSWDNAGGSGVYYPLIDYGTYSEAGNKKNWHYATFRPALYVKEYIDKMFAAAGFTYDCPLFESNRFKSLVIPHNRKILTSSITRFLDFTRATLINILSYASPGHTNEAILWETINALRSFSQSGNKTFTYTGTDPITLSISFNYDFGWRLTTPGNQIIHELIHYTSGGTPTVIASSAWGTTGGSYISSGGWRLLDQLVNFTTGEYFEIRSRVTNSSDSSYLLDFRQGWLTAETQTATSSPVGYGNTVQMNDCIPKNIKQIDFLVSIVKLFNLYVFEDKNNPRKLHIMPFYRDNNTTDNGFFKSDSSNALDWTYKMNRDKPRSIKPMSELVSRVYNYSYAKDSDFFNELYAKRYNQTYGSNRFDSEFEFTTAETKVEIIFAGTPLVGYPGEAKVYSTIFKRTGSDSSPTEECCDSVIRILQTKKITGVPSWNILDDSGSTLTSTTDYGYAGHFDQPDAPGNDLNFGTLQELFFTLVTGDLTKTQFNVYWSAYLAEITDKDSKLVTASFRLTPADIYNLDFSKYILLDGVLFRLNKITDYNASYPSDCKVELLKVINTVY